MNAEILAEKELRTLLDEHVPSARVLLFYSRANGTAIWKKLNSARRAIALRKWVGQIEGAAP